MCISCRMDEPGSLTIAKPGSMNWRTGCLAPMTRQSGNWTGHAFIQGGRHHLRHPLPMPALVAMRFSPDLKGKYLALGAAGKPAKVAIIALMRKLIILANQRVKADRLWTLQRP